MAAAQLGTVDLVGLQLPPRRPMRAAAANAGRIIAPRGFVNLPLTTSREAFPASCMNP